MVDRDMVLMLLWKMGGRISRLISAKFFICVVLLLSVLLREAFAVVKDSILGLFKLLRRIYEMVVKNVVGLV